MLYQTQLVSMIGCYGFGDWQVETIGDAYMVVSGVPEATEDHAVRIANMGLDMILETSHVINPVSEKAIQVIVSVNCV